MPSIRMSAGIFFYMCIYMTRYWWNDVLYGLAFLVGLLTRNVSGEDKSRIAKGDGFVMGGWSYIYGLVKDGQG